MAVAKLIFEDKDDNIVVTGEGYLADKPTAAQSAVAQLLGQFRKEVEHAKADTCNYSIEEQ